MKMGSSGSVKERIEMSIMIAIVMIALNSLFGIFLLPWGIIGFAFAIGDIFLALMLKKAGEIYESGDYKEAYRYLTIPEILGYFFGAIILGIYIHQLRLTIEDMIIKSKLIREPVEEKEFYRSPKIPER